MPTATANNKYTASGITVLEGLEPVRVRPSMYIGGVDKTGLHHLVWEIVDNAVDEYLNGFANNVKVTLHKPGDAITIQDNGRGIPVDIHPKHKKPGVELILTVLHSGGKFGDGDNYIHSGGLHGVGSSVVNALSRKLVATIRRDGYEWEMEFARGVPASKLKKLEKCRGTGTTIYFEPDPQIFKKTVLDDKLIRQRLEDMSYIHSGLKILFVNEVTGETFDLTHPGGIPEFLGKLITDVQKPAITEAPFTMVRENGDKVEVALQWTESTDETIRSYANGIRTVSGGTHESGFRSGIVKAVNNYIKTHEVKFRKGLNITAEDIREGIVGIVSVFLRTPEFQGQTKEKLNNTEMNSTVDGAIRPALESWLNSNKTAAEAILYRIKQSAEARQASREAASEIKRKSVTSRRLNLPGKLADCKSTDLGESELFIVEGDSAGGCFSGDTRIALADGRNLSFEELITEQAQGLEHFCYTIRKNGKIGLERLINVRVTRKNAEVIRLTLDNGEIIDCTPDHRFMLRDGSYKRADQLTREDSLQPLYRKYSDINEPGITIDGYEMVWDTKSEYWLFTHMLADWYNCWTKVYAKDSGAHCHHVDFDKLNNNPTNLIRLSKEEHLAIHREHLDKTLHTAESKEKSRQIRQSQEYRSMMSERMKQSETREQLSANAKSQWEDELYKAYMMERWQEFYLTNEEYRQMNAEQLYQAQLEYWSKEENRQAQAERVRNYFETHPEARERHSELAQLQWDDEELRAWRREKTKQQWTPEFRSKRQAALWQTYYKKTIASLHSFMEPDGTLNLTEYDDHRKQTRDKSLLRFDRFCERYFDDNVEAALEAVRNHNHRIVHTERLTQRVDVYDAEVPHSHNFALASGVFVHNSAKQGRDNKTQAILPLRGKILNSEGLNLKRVLANSELSDLVSAIGTGIGDKFNISGLRYGKIILLMDADADGHHISTLLLDFFFRHMPELIRKGHVYLAQPPLYRIDVGKETHWAKDDAHREEILAGLRANAKYEITRFKGLGEMNPGVLNETTLSRKSRTLLKVDIESNPEADKIFEQLLGKDPSSRYRFIMEEAPQAVAEELDV